MSNVRLRTIVKVAAACCLSASLAACSGGKSGTSSPPPALTPTVLSGNYVFTVTGTDPNDGDYAVVGSFVADGKGNITSAVADYNLGSGVDDNVSLTGTYTISSGSIAVTLMDGGSVKDTFTTAPLSTSGISGVSSFDGTGSGKLYSQVTSGFTLPGTYSFSVSGEGDGVISGSGQFVAGASGAFTSGTATLTDAQTAMNYSPLTGLLTTPGNGGRGFASIAGNNLAYYVIGPNQIQMMGLDTRLLLTIPAQKM